MKTTVDTSKIKPNTNSIGQNVVYYKTATSTNTIAKESACIDGTLVVAEEQTSGKGRMGRVWESEQGAGIYMSVVLYPSIPAQSISLLTLVAGISTCQALSEASGIPFKIKWPNDIVADGKKVCGILTEGVISKDRSKAVVGIGVNVNNHGFDATLADKATSLFMLTGKEWERECIINKIAEYFEKNYTDFVRGIPFVEKYEKLCVNMGKAVTVIKDGSKISGTAAGVTEKGELVIKKQDGTTLNINSGEVSVRGIYGYY